MHHPAGQRSSELGFLPAMYSFPCLTTLPETTGFTIGTASSAHQRLGAPPPNTSWERRSLRKHRRRSDDEGCSAKRRRLMGMGKCDAGPSMCPSWPPGAACSLPAPPRPALPQPSPGPQGPGLTGPPSTPQPRLEADGFYMEVEAAQRRLQEIEERITLEDDEDDEDEELGVEPPPRRPVLVMSDSLREGLQHGISDILPHTVAQSVSQSCMELVVWRPPEDALSRRFRDTLQRQRRQQTASRQPPAPGLSSSPPRALQPSRPAGEAYPPLGCTPGEEDMEL